MFGFFNRRDYRYSPLQNGAREKVQYCSQALLVKAIVALAFITTSFLAGRLSITTDTRTAIQCALTFLYSLLIVPRVMEQQDQWAKLKRQYTVLSSSRIFEYAPIFGSPPSNASNKAWSHIFPEQGGFFKHPNLAPERSAFSVFHQLHCLVTPLSSSLKPPHL